MKWDRLATVGVPIGAGIMTAAVLLGPAEERPASGARAHGAIAVGARVCAFRLETLEHLGGVRRPTAMTGIDVVLEAPDGQPLCEWSGDTDARGLAETSARMRRPAAKGETLSLVARSKARILAHAELSPSPPGERATPPSWTVVGPPAATITLPRGHVVPELPEPVLVEITSGAERPTIEVETTGAEHGHVRARKVGCEGDRCKHVATIEVTARAPTVRIALDVTADDATSHWEGDLPIVPGGVWLDRAALAQGILKLRSATPRETVFVSKYNSAGRLWGTTIAMTTDERGFSEGQMALPGGVDDGTITYRLSSEPAEPPEATIGWPGLRMEWVAGVPMRPLADGLEAAIAAEQERMGRSRLPAFGLIVAAGLFEVLYLLRRYRRQGEALDEHLEEQLQRAPTGIRARTPIAWLTFLSAILVLAFFILAAVAFWA